MTEAALALRGIDPVLVIAIAIPVALVIAVFARLAALQRRVERLSRIEAKVDALMRASNVSFDPLRDAPNAVRQALEAGDKILAIKTYREMTGAGLKEAKDFVDELQRRARAIR